MKHGLTVFLELSLVVFGIIIVYMLMCEMSEKQRIEKNEVKIENVNP